ncbi:MAG: DsbA family oxidoreductase, partial [Burkholderiales bacterium]|nr:DsbA family oxidoreductase [Burkholderiales bacterium]
MMQIEFVSDIVCPWCAIGLASLDQALAQVGPEIGPVSLRFQPFELNPQMPPEGEEIAEHLSRKYGRTREELAGAAQMIQQRAEGLGFPMRTANRTRIWNTFDGHRLLHWAGTVGEAPQKALKQALLLAYHRDGLNPADPAVLQDTAHPLWLLTDRLVALSQLDLAGQAPGKIALHQRLRPLVDALQRAPQPLQSRHYEQARVHLERLANASLP